MKNLKSYLLLAMLALPLLSHAQATSVADKNQNIKSGRKLRIYDTANTNYLELSNNGTNSVIDTLTGSVSFPDGVTSSITGNVTGNVTGNLTGAVTGTTLSASTSLTVGTGGFAVTKILSGTATIDFANTSTLTSSDSADVTVTGAGIGDYCFLATPTPNANTSYSCYVNGANTAKVRFNNYSSGSVDPASGSFSVMVFH